MHIIPVIIIVILAIAIGCLYLNKQQKTEEPAEEVVILNTTEVTSQPTEEFILENEATPMPPVEINCKWDEMEPMNFMAITDGEFYYDPNYLDEADDSYDGSFRACGTYTIGEEFDFTYRTYYNKEHCYAFMREDGVMVVAKKRDFEKVYKDPVAITPEMMEERRNKILSEKLGITVDEVKAMMAEAEARKKMVEVGLINSYQNQS